MTSLELNADCSLKYVSAWSLHSSLHIYLLQQSDSTVPSLANALSHCEILYCVTYFLEWQLHKSWLWTAWTFVAATTESSLTWKICNSLPCSILGCFKPLTSACSKAKFKNSKKYPNFSGLFRLSILNFNLEMRLKSIFFQVIWSLLFKILSEHQLQSLPTLIIRRMVLVKTIKF